MKLRVEPATQDILRELAAGEKSMGKLLDDLAPALQAELEHIENGGGDRSPVTAVIRRVMVERRIKGIWTEDEFRTLLANESLSDWEISTRLGRSPGAVGVVRAGVQRWRSGENNKGILSKMMIKVLEETHQSKSTARG